MNGRKGILERLAEGPVVGDGGMATTLEKRGYCKAGTWTNEAVVKYPDAVLQLHREFARAGADVVRTFSSYGNNDKFLHRKNHEEFVYTADQLNTAACKLARKVADENNRLVCADLTPTTCFFRGEVNREEFAKRIRITRNEDVDFVMAKNFCDIRETEMCAEEVKKLNLPMALSMGLGVTGDVNGVSIEECATRMAKTGAQIIGINCSYDIDSSLKVIKRMKVELDKENLDPYLMCQPIGLYCPEVEQEKFGSTLLPEIPFVSEGRVLTAIETHKFARAAFEIGVRYIGGCCYFEPHHIRAIAHELVPERGRSPPCRDKTDPLKYDSKFPVNSVIMSVRKGILERLAEGPVVGDGSMAVTLEKRGYCKAGPWTPEAVVEYPDAVLQLHREFVRAGADVVQTYAFYSSDDKLAYRRDDVDVVHTSVELNEAACKLARKAADENNCLVCAGLSPVPSFVQGKSEEIVSAEFAKQIRVFQNHDVDFVMAEFFADIREVELCAKEMKKMNKPMALCMRIGTAGDIKGVTVEECAVRMAKTGASIVGTNCAFDANTALRVIKRMKDALAKEHLNPYLICQPLGMFCPEVEETVVGRTRLPESPLAIEPRVMTRIEAHRFARAAWELGVRYIGGCCGFEPYHIRAISQELALERGKQPPGQDMSEAFGGKLLRQGDLPSFQKKSTREFWHDLKPGTGRPYNAPLSQINDAAFETRN